MGAKISRTEYGYQQDLETIAKELGRAKIASRTLANMSQIALEDKDPAGNLLPVGIALISDLHIGGSGTDYDKMFDDARIVKETPGMYAMLPGDNIDNFIKGKLVSANFATGLPVIGQWALFQRFLEIISSKLIAAVAGNHDNWTLDLAAVDYLAHLLPNYVLYDPYEVRTTIKVGKSKWNMLLRHKVRYSSIYNPLHGIKQHYRNGDWAFDIGVAGHVHRGAVYEPFYAHGKKRWAILCGTYKKIDSYPLAEGFVGGGEGDSVALIMTPDGRMEVMDDLRLAASFLGYLRQQYTSPKPPDPE